MEDFSEKTVWGFNISEDDKGVSVSSAMQIATANGYYNDIITLLNIEAIKSETIDIPGAGTLVNSLQRENDRFIKFDFESDYHDLDFFYEDGDNGKDFYISFLNVQSEYHKSMVGGKEFTCATVYSSKSDFFKNTFLMQSFASDLVKKNLSNFVKRTLDELKNYIKRGDHKWYYRILKDKKGKLYLRAIVSDRYKDYDDNITVLLALIGLHKESKRSGHHFSVQRIDYNESFVRVAFAKSEDRIIEGIGRMQYVIEVSNDEVKRNPLKFIGAATIIYGDEEDGGELYIKPSRLRSKILSIKHNTKPETAIQALSELANYMAKEEEMYNDILNISKIDNPNTVRHLIYNRIKNTNKAEIQKSKTAIMAELNTTVDNLHQLFVALDKVDKLTKDIEAKEYLRYLFFDALVYRKLSKDEDMSDDKQ